MSSVETLGEEDVMQMSKSAYRSSRIFRYAFSGVVLGGLAASGAGIEPSFAQYGGDEFGLSRKGLVQAIETVEPLIASCMRQAGFEYVAASYDTIRAGMVSDKSLPGYSERQFIREFGFGISTVYTGHGPQDPSYRTPAQIGLGNRNVEIFRNLSPADQVAYNRALFGENADVTFAVGLEIEDFSATGGCTRRAVEQVFTPEQMKVTYLNPLDAAVDADPRMAAANERWIECMRQGGFNYNHEKEVEPDIRARLHAITQGQPVETLPPEARTALQNLQNYERALARVAVYCEEQVLDPVANRIERELLAR